MIGHRSEKYAYFDTGMRKTKHDWNAVIEKYKILKSMRKVADELCISKSGVEHILKRVGVDRFPQGRSGNENSIRKAIGDSSDSNPSKQVRSASLMYELYVDKNLSTTEIGAKLGLSPSTVLTGLAQCGIKPRSISAALKGKPRYNSQGSKNHNWKGGLSGWRKLARGRLNEHFVRPIMERDNFKCTWCDSKKNIVVHHDTRSFMQIVKKVESKVHREDVEKFVNAIVDEHNLSDGVTLCKKCHDSYHKENGK